MPQLIGNLRNVYVARWIPLSLTLDEFYCRCSSGPCSWFIPKLWKKGNNLFGISFSSICLRLLFTSDGVGAVRALLIK